jgi:hypothetical protein
MSISARPESASIRSGFSASARSNEEIAASHRPSFGHEALGFLRASFRGGDHAKGISGAEMARFDAQDLTAQRSRLVASAGLEQACGPLHQGIGRMTLNAHVTNVQARDAVGPIRPVEASARRNPQWFNSIEPEKCRKFHHAAVLRQIASGLPRGRTVRSEGSNAVTVTGKRDGDFPGFIERTLC